MRREDPNFIPPNFAHASSAKRVRETEEYNVRTKREKVADDDDEEMDIDDDDDDEAGPPQPNSTSCISVFNYGTMFTSSCSTAHPAQVQPSNKLQCSNLPQEVTNGVLAVLFQQYALMAHSASRPTFNKSLRYRGFQTAQVKPSTKPNTSGEKVKTAEVVFENAQLAAAARQMLDGFQLKKGWNMSVTFLP